MREPFLKLFQKTSKQKPTSKKINPAKAAELSMPEHLTSRSMLKDLSTETKYLKSEKGIIYKPTTIHFVSAIFRSTLSKEACREAFQEQKQSSNVCQE